MSAVAPIVAVWLGSSAPVRSIRWLDGTLKAAGKFGGATAVAAGASPWLDLAADRALRLGIAAVGVQTDLQLDYLGWAQIMQDDHGALSGGQALDRVLHVLP